MSGSLPWAQAPQAPPSNDPTALLQQIELNTRNLLHWVRILVAAVVVMGLVIVIFV